MNSLCSLQAAAFFFLKSKAAAILPKKIYSLISVKMKKAKLRRTASYFCLILKANMTKNGPKGNGRRAKNEQKAESGLN